MLDLLCNSATDEALPYSPTASAMQQHTQVLMVWWHAQAMTTAEKQKIREKAKRNFHAVFCS
jgi:hypothetical protein